MAAQVVSFRCVLKNKLGRVLSSTFNQNVLTSCPHGQKTLATLADALTDVRKGEKRQVCLRADQAYGYYNPELVIERSLEDVVVNEPIQVGERIVYVANGRKGLYRVVSITGDSVTLDGNHPLAGQDLVFEIEATEARAATPEEIAEASEAAETVLLH